MASKAFSGDLIHELPKGKIEPYRLWFEYLKYALEVTPSRVNQNYYEKWGDVLNSEFDEWFKHHWKELFAVPASVAVVSDIEDAQLALSDADVMLVRVSNRSPVRRQIADFAKAINNSSVTNRARMECKPLFSIDSKRSMDLVAIRSMLKLLRLVQQHQAIELAAKGFASWANEWNNKIRIKPNDKRKEIKIPRPIQRLVTEIAMHKKNEQQQNRKLKKRPNL